MLADDKDNNKFNFQNTNKISRQKRYSSINDHKKYERENHIPPNGPLQITLSGLNRHDRHEIEETHYPNTIRNLQFVTTSDTGFQNESNSGLRKHGTLKKMTKTHTENLQNQSHVVFE